MVKSSEAYYRMLECIKKCIIDDIRDKIRENEDVINLRDYDIYIAYPSNPECQMLVVDVAMEGGIIGEEDRAISFYDADVSDLCYILECIEEVGM